GPCPAAVSCAVSTTTTTSAAPTPTTPKRRLPQISTGKTRNGSASDVDGLVKTNCVTATTTTPNKPASSQARGATSRTRLKPPMKRTTGGVNTSAPTASPTHHVRHPCPRPGGFSVCHCAVSAPTAAPSGADTSSTTAASASMSVTRVNRAGPPSSRRKTYAPTSGSPRFAIAKPTDARKV